jgi:hypothetical protein
VTISYLTWRALNFLNLRDLHCPIFTQGACSIGRHTLPTLIQSDLHPFDHSAMAKEEVKKEKKSKRKSEGNATEVGDSSAMSVDASAEKKSKKEKKEKKVKTEDEDEDMEEDAVAKGEVSPDAISPIARESASYSARE